ncbi:hypothetical protein Tco_0531376 [Tanacetum coccineum]
MSNVKKSIAERTRHKKQYDRRMNKRQIQTQESKVDEGKALDADLVDTESIRTDSIVQDESNRSGHDTDADDADIRPIYDEEPMAEESYSSLAQAGTSINVSEEQGLDLSAGTLCNINKENLGVWLLKRLISQKPLWQSAPARLLKDKSAQIESRARRDQITNLIRPTIEDGTPIDATSNKLLVGCQTRTGGGVATLILAKSVHKSHAHTQAFKVIKKNSYYRED